MVQVIKPSATSARTPVTVITRRRLPMLLSSLLSAWESFGSGPSPMLTWASV
jgi:hypothetical protein